MNTLLSIFSFLFGSVIGSFLNVLIYRIPIGLSIITPNSFCPHCKKPIKWYENIPIFSYLFLKGRCSRCRRSISIHYPLIEFITACLFLFLFMQHKLSLEFFAYILFFCSLIVISGIDYNHQIIPDIISIPGILVGITFQIAKGNFLPGLVGAVFGGGLIFLIRVIGGRVYKKEVMGLGDVYLTAMIGAFVGFPFIIMAIFIAALTGSIIGIIFVASTHQSRESPIPFGPFLSIGGIFVIIFKAQIIHFFSLLGVYLIT